MIDNHPSFHVLLQVGGLYGRICYCARMISWISLTLKGFLKANFLLDLISEGESCSESDSDNDDCELGELPL